MHTQLPKLYDIPSIGLLKNMLIEKAKGEYGENISTCGSQTMWMKCLTIEPIKHDDYEHCRLILWYDDENRSTHCQSVEILNPLLGVLNA